jgi:hypothetical protein
MKKAIRKALLEIGITTVIVLATATVAWFLMQVIYLGWSQQP